MKQMKRILSCICLVAMLLSYMVFPAGAAEVASGSTAAYLGIDKTTGGANWEANYGLTQTVLPGRNFAEDPATFSSKSTRTENVNINGELVTITRYGVNKYFDQVQWLRNTNISYTNYPSMPQWYMKLTEGSTPALAWPEGYAAENTDRFNIQAQYDTYCIVNDAAYLGGTPNPGFEVKANHYYTGHVFHNLAANKTYRFSLFSDNRYQLNGSLKLYFYDFNNATATLLQTVTVKMSDFNGGGYANFLVATGTTKLYVVVERSELAFGINGFFLDEVTAGENFVSNLAAQKKDDTGIQLTWNEAAGASGNVTIARAESENGEYTTIASVPAGTKAYTDTGLTTGKTYYYKIRTTNSTKFSNYTDAVSCALVQIQEPEKNIFLGIDKATGGANWEGNYGLTQTMLPGRTYTRDPGTDGWKQTEYVSGVAVERYGVSGYKATPESITTGVYMDQIQWRSNTAANAITNTTYPTRQNWYVKDTPSLAFPQNYATQYSDIYATQSLYDSYFFNHDAGAVNTGITGFSVAMESGYYYTVHCFANLTANQTYRFSLFSDNRYQQTGYVDVYFYNNKLGQGEMLQQATLQMSDFTDGGYANFLVTSDSTNLMVIVKRSTRLFGINGFFFDEVTAGENFVSNLAAQKKNDTGIQLTWNEAAGANGNVTIARAESENGEYAAIASVPAGTKSYTDAGLATGKTYYYKLCTTNKTSASAYTAAASCELPEIYEAPELVINLGLDMPTGGMNWEGNYGSAQTILPGLLINTDAAPTDYTMKYPFVRADGSSGYTDIYFKNGNNLSALDYHSNTSAGAITAVSVPGGERMYFPFENTNGQAMALPTALADSVPEWLKGYNTAYMRGHKVAYGYSDSIVPLGEEDSRTIHTFDLPEDKYYRFAAFSNNWYNQAGTVTFWFIKDGVVVQKQEIDMQMFNGGAYAIFLVKGDFTLYVDKTSDYFGINGFFFDEKDAENFTDTPVVAQAENRNVTLTWTESNAPANSVAIILRADMANGWYEPIGAVRAGVCTYTDENIAAGVNYSYRLLIRDGENYSEVYKDVTHSVTYQTVELTFDAERYTAQDSTEDVTVQVTLKDAEGNALAGKGVALHIEWAIDALGRQGMNSRPTNADGVATFVFKADYLGNATIVASIEDDDVDKLQASSAVADLFIGGKTWEAPAMIWKISDAIKPGDTVGIYGYALMRADGSAPSVKIAAHGAGLSAAQPLEVLQYDYEDGLYCMVILPSHYQPGLYDLWVDNGYGNSEVLVLNAARPLFISDYEAWAGQTIEMSGRSMAGEAFGAANATVVHLVNGSQRYEQKVTKQTPYSISFEIHKDTPVGTYTVEVSNDNGVTWATLQSGQTLTVVAAGQDPLGLDVAWMDDFIWENVYTVAPSGADDTAAINAALTQAHAAGGGVVQLSAGTYYVSGMITVRENTVLMGAGKEETNIVYCGENQAIMLFKAITDIGNIGFARFNVSLADPNKRVDSFFWIGHDWSAAYTKDLRTADQFFMYDVKVVSGDTDYALNTPNNVRGMSCVFLVNQRILVQGCEFIGFNMGWSNTKVTEYMTVRDTHWNLTSGNIFTPASYTFIMDSSVTGIFLSKEDSAYTDATNTHGFSVRGYSHVEGSTVSNVGTRREGMSVDRTAAGNDGETFMFESQDHADFGVVVNATATTLTVYPNDGQLNELIPSASCNIFNWNRVAVLITEGRGVGQIRTITNIDYENRVLTISEPWDVMPDSTSRFKIYNPSECITFYNNAESNSAKGIYLYGDGFDVVVANHTAINTEGIVMNNQQWSGAGARCWAGYYVDIRDSSITGVSARTGDSKIGIINGRSVNKEGYHYSVSAIGVEIRNNTMTNGRTEAYNYFAPTKTEGMFGTGIYLRCGVGNKDGVDSDSVGVIIENNHIQDQYHAIHYTISVRGLVLKDNTIANCTVQEGKVAMSDLEKEETSVVKQIVRYTSEAAAMVNGTQYTSLDAAVAAATAGQTIQLLKDVSATGVVIKEDITLDLNGHVLAVDYLVAFGNGEVRDVAGYGLLKCTSVRLTKNNSQMPVWDETSQGYRFFTMADHQMYWSQAENSFTFVAKPALGNLTNDKYLAAAQTNGLKVKTRIRWQSAAGNDVDQMFTFKAEDVVKTYQNDNNVLQLKVTGTAAYANKLWTTMWIESETGVIWQGAELLYTGTNP